MKLEDLINDAKRFNLNRTDIQITRILLLTSTTPTWASTSLEVTEKMPSLRELDCYISLPDFDLSLPEGITTYDESSVWTHVAIPPARSLPFEIRLTSAKNIAPGLVIYVFINGEYERRLKQTGNYLRDPSSDTGCLVDVRVRQRVKHLEDGSTEPTKMMFEDEVKSNGTLTVNIERIEVVVLRCAEPRSERSSSRKHIRSSNARNMSKEDNILHEGMSNLGLDGANDEPDVSRSWAGDPREFHAHPHAAYYPPYPPHRVSSRDPPLPPPQYLRTRHNTQPPPSSMPAPPSPGQGHSGHTNRGYHANLPAGWYEYGTGPVASESHHRESPTYPQDSKSVPQTQWQEDPRPAYDETYRTPSGAQTVRSVPGSWPDSPAADCPPSDWRPRTLDEQMKYDPAGFWGNAEWKRWEPPTPAPINYPWSETDSDTESSGTWDIQERRHSQPQTAQFSGDSSRSRYHGSSKRSENTLTSHSSRSNSTVRAPNTSVRISYSSRYHRREPDSETSSSSSETESENTWTPRSPNPPPSRPAPAAASAAQTSPEPGYRIYPPSGGSFKDEYANYLAEPTPSATKSSTTLRPSVPPPHLAPPPLLASSSHPSPPKVTHVRRIERIFSDNSKISIPPPAKSNTSASRDVWTAYGEKQPRGKAGFFDTLLGPVADEIAKKAKKNQSSRRRESHSRDKEGVLVDTSRLKAYEEQRVEDPDVGYCYSAYGVGIPAETSNLESESQGESDSHGKSEAQSERHPHKHRNHHHRRHHHHRDDENSSSPPASPSRSRSYGYASHSYSSHFFSTTPLKHSEDLAPPTVQTIYTNTTRTPSKHSRSRSTRHSNNITSNSTDDDLIDTLEKPFAKFIFDVEPVSSTVFDEVLQRSQDEEERKRSERVGAWVRGQIRKR